MSELPKGWVNTELEKIITPSKKKLQPEEFQDLVYLSLKHIDADSNFINGSGDVSSVKSTKSRFYAGDVLYGRLRPYLNKVCMPDFEGVCSTEILIFSPSSGLYNPFLKHYLSSAEFVDYASSNSKGINLPRISQKEIDKKSVNLPPLNEQKRIADKLDQVLEEINSAKSRLDQIPTILKNFRQSVLKAYLDPKATWKSKKLGDLLEDLRYGTSKKCSYDNDGTPILRIPNVSDGKIDPNDMKYTQLGEKEYSKLSLRKGDILIIRSNGSISLVGKTALINKEESGWGFAGYLIRLRFDPNKIDPVFLNYYLAAPKIRDYIELTGRSTNGVNNINSKEISNIEIVYPDIEEQRKLAAQITELMTLSSQIEGKYNLAMGSVDKITQSTLKKAFCGELVPQDPNDEHASILLERIKTEKILKKLIPKQKHRKTLQKNKEIKKMILSVLDTLRKEKKPLTAQNLFKKSGYPDDSDPEKIEKFFLDIKKSLDDGTIIRKRVKNEDIFRLVA